VVLQLFWLKNIFVLIIMKYFLFIYLSLFLLNNNNVFSQEKVSYTTVDYTDKLSPFKLSLTLLGLDAMAPQAGATVEGVIGKRIGYNVCYRRNLSKYAFITNKNYVLNKTDVKFSNYIEGGIDYFLFDKIKDNGSVNVTTSEWVNGNTSYTKSFKAIVKKRKQKGIHLGLINYNRMFFTSSDTLEVGNIEFTNDNGKKLKPQRATYGTNSINNVLYAGFVFKRVIKSTVSSEGWRYYKHFSRRFYVDVLFGSTTFNNIEVNGVSYTATSSKINPLGYRLGFEWDGMGCVVGFEFGMRPGVQYVMPYYNYFNLNFSFNIINGDKRYAMKLKK
jgi:hypothetical protein